MHFVFVETNRPGLAGLEAALRRGFRVSFIKAKNYEELYMSPAARAILDRVHRVLDLEDSSDPSQLEEGLRTLASDTPIDGVTTVIQLHALPVAHVARRLGLPGADPEAIRIARDKIACRYALQRAGVASTEFAPATCAMDVTRFAALHGYPVVVKPATGTAKLLTQLLHDEAAVSDYFAHLAAATATMKPIFRREVESTLLVEKRLVGPMYSVEIGVHNGRFTTFMVSKRKRTDHDEIIELGTSMPCELSASQRDEMSDYVERVLRVLGLDLGIFHVEVILTTEGPRLVEVNPRLMGGNMPDLYALATGDDIYDHLVDIHLGRDPRPCEHANMAATSRTIAGLCDGRVRDDLPPDWLDEFRPLMARCQISVQAGQRIQRVTDNFGTYGFFQVTAGTHEDSVALADSLVRRIAQRLGVELAT